MTTAIEVDLKPQKVTLKELLIDSVRTRQLFKKLATTAPTYLTSHWVQERSEDLTNYLQALAGAQRSNVR